MTTLYYRQTQNECAGAAVLHAIGWPHHAADWHPIAIADAACLIDPFPHNDTTKGGTTIKAVLEVAQRHKLIRRCAPIGQNLALLDRALANGQRAVGNIPSGIQTAGRELNHAVCVTSAIHKDGTVVGYRIYDPAYGHDGRVLIPDAFRYPSNQTSRGLWLIDVDKDGICYELHKDAIKRRYLAIAAGVALVFLAAYAIFS
jgi:hypothetical protein